MTSHKSAVVYELLSGLFGWVWILAGIGVLVFVGMALFGDYPWWWAGVAFLVSAVAKWLTRGFKANQVRVMYEAKLRQDGLSSEEAGQKWVEDYNQGKLG